VIGQRISPCRSAAPAGGAAIDGRLIERARSRSVERRQTSRERALLGLQEDELPQGGAWRDLIHPDDRALVDAAILPHLRGEVTTYGCEHRMMHKAGHYIWLSSRAMIVERDSDSRPLRIIGTHLDITERKHADDALARTATLLKHSEERLSLALEGSGLALFDWDIGGDRIYQSAGASAMRGDAPAEETASPSQFRSYVHPDDLDAMRTNMKAALTGAVPVYHAEFRLRKGTGEWLWVRARGRIVDRDANGRALRLAGTYADINARRAVEERLRRQAEFDTLTDLPNRALFRERLQQALRRVKRGSTMALLFLDIDHFKTVNDTLGHEAGDQLLKVFATRMRDCVKQSDTVARLSGDEFTVILEGLGGADDAKALAGKLVETLGAPVALAGMLVEVTVSIGIALSRDDQTDDAQILGRADAALYEAKRRGRNGFFCDELDTLAAALADFREASTAVRHQSRFVRAPGTELEWV
jgi:diguanylate cyclase (GGDEF)-like protein/PAS domain S-box-containing protein